MAFQAMPFHSGEKMMHSITKVPVRDNPMNPGLTARAAHQIAVYPLMALGAIDPNNEDRPWCTLWGGEAPIAQLVARGGIIGIRTTVDASFDPVVNVLFGSGDGGEVKQFDPDKGPMVSALSINLEERSRVKLYGRMMAGALSVGESNQDATQKHKGDPGSAQLVLRIEQSLGNCPKYLNKKVITSHNPKPQLASTSIVLSDDAIDLIRQADLFFVSSAHKFEDMDTNHRGGPPGFLRVQQPDVGSLTGSVLVWPEYSGNNLYQTLGNLMETPRAGLCIPNFETGDVLYVTGDTEVLFNDDATKILAKTKLAVRLTVTGTRLVKDGLGFRGAPSSDSAAGRSPYNPRVRFLQSEKAEELGSSKAGVTASLIKKTRLTPTITKYRFSLSDPSALGPRHAGQYVAFDFSDEMDMGYSHMRDDDPQSLNDDFIRTFTVSSPPRGIGLHDEEFEVTIRKVGSVTGWLRMQNAGMTEVGVTGFGGNFSLDVKEGQKAVFIAGGIGITPFLAEAPTVKGLLVRWTIGIRDVGVVLDVWNQCPDELRRDMIVYLTGKEEDLVTDEDREAWKQVSKSELRIERRRMQKEDLTTLQDQVTAWYLCTSPTIRNVIQEWLPGTNIIFENFDY